MIDVHEVYLEIRELASELSGIKNGYTSHIKDVEQEKEFLIDGINDILDWVEIVEPDMKDPLIQVADVGEYTRK